MTAESAKNLAIIDDDTSVRQSMTRLLTAAGFLTKSFASGEEFLAASDRRFDCVILDVRMPGMTGFEVHEALEAAGTRQPIVFVTADAVPSNHSSNGNKKRTILKKPFDCAALIAAINAVMQAA